MTTDDPLTPEQFMAVWDHVQPGTVLRHEDADWLYALGQAHERAKHTVTVRAEPPHCSVCGQTMVLYSTTVPGRRTPLTGYRCPNWIEIREDHP